MDHTKDAKPIKGILKKSSRISMDNGTRPREEPVARKLSQNKEREARAETRRTDEVLTPDKLALRLASLESVKTNVPQRRSSESKELDADADLPPEEREKRKQFEIKRKAHSNEGIYIKFARQLLEKEEEEDEDDGGDGSEGMALLDQSKSATGWFKGLKESRLSGVVLPRQEGKQKRRSSSASQDEGCSSSMVVPKLMEEEEEGMQEKKKLF